MPQQNPQVETSPDYPKFKALFDQLTAHVSGCSGYTFECLHEGLVLAQFRFPGGHFPLAIDPEKPFAHNVKVLQGAIRLNQYVARLPVLVPR